MRNVNCGGGILGQCLFDCLVINLSSYPLISVASNHGVAFTFNKKDTVHDMALLPLDFHHWVDLLIPINL